MKEIDGRDGTWKDGVFEIFVCVLLPIAAVMTIGWLSDALR